MFVDRSAFVVVVVAVVVVVVVDGLAEECSCSAQSIDAVAVPARELVSLHGIRETRK